MADERVVWTGFDCDSCTVYEGGSFPFGVYRQGYLSGDPAYNVWVYYYDAAFTSYDDTSKWTSVFLGEVTPGVYGKTLRVDPVLGPGEKGWDYFRIYVRQKDDSSVDHWSDRVNVLANVLTCEVNKTAVEEGNHLAIVLDYLGAEDYGRYVNVTARYMRGSETMDIDLGSRYVDPLGGATFPYKVQHGWDRLKIHAVDTGRSYVSDWSQEVTILPAPSTCGCTSDTDCVPGKMCDGCHCVDKPDGLTCGPGTYNCGGSCAECCDDSYCASHQLCEGGTCRNMRRSEPTITSVTTLTRNALRVEWTHPVESYEGTLVRYRIHRRLAGSTQWTVAGSTRPDTLLFDVGDLSAGQTYYIVVEAVWGTTQNGSTFSDEVGGTTESAPTSCIGENSTCSGGGCCEGLECRDGWCQKPTVASPMCKEQYQACDSANSCCNGYECKDGQCFASGTCAGKNEDCSSQGCCTGSCQDTTVCEEGSGSERYCCPPDAKGVCDCDLARDVNQCTTTYKTNTCGEGYYYNGAECLYACSSTERWSFTRKRCVPIDHPEACNGCGCPGVPGCPADHVCQGTRYPYGGECVYQDPNVCQPGQKCGCAGKPDCCTEDEQCGSWSSNKYCGCDGLCKEKPLCAGWSYGDDLCPNGFTCTGTRCDFERDVTRAMRCASDSNDSSGNSKGGGGGCGSGGTFIFGKCFRVL